MARLGRGSSVVRWPWVGQTFLAVVLLATLLQAQSPPSKSLPKPPATRTDNVTETLHGVEVTDPYRWLEDQESPETRGWIATQNAYTDSVLSDLPGVASLKQRLTPLIKTDFIGTPTERGGRFFFSMRLADQEQSILYVRNGLKGKDEVLIDPNPMSPDHTTSVQIAEVSDDGKMIIYRVRQGGEDETRLQAFDVDSRKNLSDSFSRARYSSVSLTRDKTSLYYTKQTSAGPRVFYHKMGSDPAGDPEIFGTGFGVEKIVGSSLSLEGRYILYTVAYGSAADRTELYFQDLSAKRPLVTLVKDIPARFSGGRIIGDQLFLQTNWKAPKNRILLVDLKNPAQENWRDIIPEGDAVLQGFNLVGGKLVATYSKDAMSRAKIFEPNGKLVREVSLPGIGSIGGFSGRWGSQTAFYSYNSFVVPTTIYRYDMARGSQQIWSQLKVPVDAAKIEVKQVWYSSKDGTRVPMFVVYPKAMRFDGSSLALLTGYGGFNATQSPGFSARAVAWVESGGVYAVANLRGGSEYGEEWHRAGMLEKKQNVFDDFIGAAEWLIANNYTSASKLAIRGGSNGGLLVGAALAQRPELFAAVVCSYPLLDMVRYHKFLVARYWVPEYGSAEDAAQFPFIHAYSPYHNIKPGTKYPAVLFVTGDADTRVAPLHARKMTALMQAATGSDRPIVLRYDTKAGHSGGTPVSKQVDELAEELAFLFWQLHVAPAQGP